MRRAPSKSPAGQDHPSPRRRRLPRHAARRAGHLPRSHRPPVRLHRGARDMNVIHRAAIASPSPRASTGWPLRAPHRLASSRRLREFHAADDSLAKAARFWNGVADGPGTRDRALIVGGGLPGVTSSARRRRMGGPRKTRPHRADVAKMLVRWSARRLGAAPRCCAAAERRGHSRGTDVLVLRTASPDTPNGSTNG